MSYGLRTRVSGVYVVFQEQMGRVSRTRTVALRCQVIQVSI